MSTPLEARNRLDGTDLRVSQLCLGGNVFGWTADEAGSVDVLDAFAAAGGNFVDTADSYANWVPGNAPGSSERIIGAWLRRRGRRDDVVIATKCGFNDGLAADAIRHAADGSLARLGIETIDLYYAHKDDPTTPLDETLGALAELVRAGKVRQLAASNYSADRLAEALAISDREGWPRFVALQPHYNLVERGYEGALAEVCTREGLAVAPYYALASGFLTGKYRGDGSRPDGPRRRGAEAYLDERGRSVLAALDDVARAHETTVAAVALAWLASQPNVVAPIASARTPEQLADLVKMGTLTLSPDEVRRLSDASDEFD